MQKTIEKFKNLKIRSKILFIFSSVAIIGFGIGLGFSFPNISATLRNQISDFLETSASIEADRVNNLIQERIDDLFVLSLTSDVRNMLSEKNNDEVSVVKKEIKQVSERVAFEIEIFLKNNPDMTIKDLQESEEFQKIAVQRVGKTGYTALTDYDSLVCRFHDKESIVDLDLSTLSEDLPGFWSVMSKTKNGIASGGFYDWMEPDGSMRKKYMYIDIVDGKTADGVGLSVAATTYVSEYSEIIKVAKEAEEFLKEIKKTYGVHDILVIGRDADIWWSDLHQNFVGVDLSDEAYSDLLIFKAFEEIKNGASYVVTELDSIDPKHGLFFSTLFPVYGEGGEFLGVLAALIDIDEISKMLEGGLTVEKNGEVFLVGQDGLMRSDSAHAEDGVLKQKISSNNLRFCLDHYDNYFDEETKSFVKHDERVEIYEAYWGEKVLGTHSHISELGWCLLVEFPLKEVYGPIYSLAIIYVGIGIFLLALFIFASRFIGNIISEPIEKLMNGVELINKGDLKQRVMVESGDELGDLARSFNDMAKKLQDSYQGLETKVKERTQSLEKTMRLMVGRELKMSELKKQINEMKKENEEKDK